MKQNGSLKRFFSTLFVFLLGVLVAGLSALVCFTYSANYSAIYGYAEAQGGVKDCSSATLPINTYYAWERMSGEYEFYYNQWIVSAPPAQRTLTSYREPGTNWTQEKDAQGHYLPQGGYASYRLKIIHVPTAYLLQCCYVTGEGCWRIYANGTLVAERGEAGKTPQESFRALRDYTFSKVFSADQEGNIDYVIELGNLNNGGLFDVPSLSRQDPDHAFVSSGTARLNTSLLIGAVLVSAALIAASVIIGHLFGAKGMGRPVAGLLGALFLAFFFSVDMQYFVFYFDWVFDFAIGLIGTLLFEAVLNILIVVYLKKGNYIAAPRLVKGNWAFWVYAGLNVALAIMAIFSYGSTLQILWWFLLAGLPFVYEWKAAKSVTRKGKNAWAVLFLIPVLSNFFLAQAYDDLGLIIFQTTDFPSISMLVLSLIVSVIFVRKIRSIRQEEIAKDRLALAYTQVKQEALKAQIKPHFIFNCLTAIEASYHKDLLSGDEAMKKFAHHLRQDVDSLNVDLIPFEEEINAILNYVDLENIRLEKPFTLLLDIEEQDFLIPPFSLQPLVENAIKYSQSNLKKDGYIEISTRKNEEGKICINVSDNGVGFDPHATKTTSQGLRNLKERLELILQAEVTLFSQPGEGSQVSIVFSQPKKKLGEINKH